MLLTLPVILPYVFHDYNLSFVVKFCSFRALAYTTLDDLFAVGVRRLLNCRMRCEKCIGKNCCVRL